MPKLPKFYSESQDFTLMQSQWAKMIDPVLSNPLNNSLILKEVSLVTGSNQIAHRLGRNLQGWFIVRKRADASIYDTQDSNQMPSKFLSLVTDADVVVDLIVF